MHKLGMVFICAAALAWGGCGDDDGVDAGSDAGSGADIGGNIDSGADTGGSIDSGTDAGGGVDAGSDTGGGADAGTDGGAPLPVCGTPPVVALTVADTCPEFAACGGDIMGTWDFSGGCVAVDLSTVMMCPGAMVTRREGSGRGCVQFDGVTARRVAEAYVSGDVFIPSLCAMFIGGCDAIEMMVTDARPDAEATCTTTAMGCDCTFSLAVTIDDNDAYTIEGNQIVSASSDKRWDYCVEGMALDYTDASMAADAEPGIFTLSMR